MSQVLSHEPLNERVAASAPSRTALIPHSYFDELAEMGALQEFLNSYMYEEFHANQHFRKQMLCLMLDNSSANDLELEFELMTDLQGALHHFIEKATSCNRIQP